VLAQELAESEAPRAPEAYDITLRFIHAAPFTSSLQASALTVRVNGNELGSLQYGQTSAHFTGVNEYAYLTVSMPERTTPVEFVNLSGSVVYSTTYMWGLNTNHSVTIVGKGTTANPISVKVTDHDIDGYYQAYVFNTIPDSSFDIDITEKRSSGDKVLYQVADLTFDTFGQFVNTAAGHLRFNIASNNGLSDFPIETPFVKVSNSVDSSPEIFIIGDGENQPYDYLYVGLHPTYTERYIFLPLVMKPSPVVAPNLTIVRQVSSHDDSADDGLYRLEWNNLSANKYETQFSYNDPNFSNPAPAETGNTSQEDIFSWPGTHYWRVRGKFYINGEMVDGPWSNVESVTVQPYAYLYVHNVSYAFEMDAAISGNGIQDSTHLSSDSDYFWRTVPVGAYNVTVTSAYISLCPGLSGSVRSETVNFTNDRYLQGHPYSGMYRIASCETYHLEY